MLRRHEECGKGKSADYSVISYLQLQTKSLLFELDQKSFRCLTQPQNRLIAECFEEFLYYEFAEKYWKEVFKIKFQNEYIESEYHRRYAQFLYNIGNEDCGKFEFNCSLKLPNSDDGRRYINIQTYISWIKCEMMKHIHSIKASKKEQLSSQLDLVQDLLAKANLIMDDISDMVLHKNALKDINGIEREISKLTVSDII